MKRNILFAVCVSLALALCPSIWAEPELKGSPEELAAYFLSQSSDEQPEILAITGAASLKIRAEHAEVLLSVISEHERFKEALAINQKMRKEAIASLIGAGVAQERIQESALSSTPQYGFIGKKPKSYAVENLLHVVVVSEQEFQAVAHIVDDVEQIFYRELTFGYPKSELNRQVLTSAYEDLAQKKRLYEDLFGLTLNLKTFTEGHVTEQSPFTGLEERKMLDYGRESSWEESAIITFGELVLTGTITATYTLHFNE